MKNQKIKISQGAEAIIELNNNQILKKRISKSYRLSELDSAIRKRRTKSEAKILEKASKVISVPKIINIDKNQQTLSLEYIKGLRLSEHLDKLKNKLQIAKKIGETISKLHEEDIIHSDLTTSNMILKGKKIFFIDFGLSYISKKVEDKAVDLHVLKQALEAKHFKFYKKLWENIEEGYKKSSETKKILERLVAVEKRGRYKKGN